MAAARLRALLVTAHETCPSIPTTKKSPSPAPAGTCSRRARRWATTCRSRCARAATRSIRASRRSSIPPAASTSSARNTRLLPPSRSVPRSLQRFGWNFSSASPILYKLFWAAFRPAHACGSPYMIRNVALALHGRASACGLRHQSSHGRQERRPLLDQGRDRAVPAPLRADRRGLWPVRRPGGAGLRQHRRPEGREATAICPTGNSRSRCSTTNR